MSVSMPIAELTGALLESLSYGVYLLVFVQCIQVLQRRQPRPSGYLVGTSVSLFVLVTAHLVVDILRNTEAFTSNMGIPNYPDIYYANFDTWKDIVKSVLYVTVTIVSDAFIMYRSFIVWGRSYFFAGIPFVLFLAEVGVGIVWVYILTLLRPGYSENVLGDAIVVCIRAFFSITLSMNVMCTCLIAFKIWRVQRAVAPFVRVSRDELPRLMAIIIESGSIYSTILVAMIATYAYGSAVMFVFLNALSPVIGIVFSSVIVRANLGLSHGDASNMRSQTAGTRMQWIVRAGGRQTTSEQVLTSSVGSLPDGRVRVALSQTVHTHIDGFPAVAEMEIGRTDVKSDGLHAV